MAFLRWLFAGCVVVVFSALWASAATLIVDPGPGPYTDIQTAIDAAAGG